MISESRYWKQPLLRTANWLERLRIDDENEDRALVRVERELFGGFYAVRKLLGTFSVSRSTRRKAFQMTWSPCVKHVDHLNSHRIDELFDLGTRHVERRDLTFLCNQFIHSFIFMSECDEHGALTGVFVSSDKMKNEKLYFVRINQILDAFRSVGRDYPAQLHLRRNSSGQWEEF
jgi:hypothetical protein